MNKSNKELFKSILLEEQERINKVIDLLDNSDKTVKEIIKQTSLNLTF
jgi:hypothetical protein